MKATDLNLVRLSDVARCPRSSLLPSHYREDGSCRCDEEEAERRQAIRYGRSPLLGETAPFDVVDGEAKEDE